MKTFFFFLLAALSFMGLAGCAESSSTEGEAVESGAEIEFQGVAYFHRWSGGNQHEYTPDGQEDLGKWTDMVTLLYYPGVKDGDGLAQVANNILEAYKQNQAVVIKTGSVPRTEKQEAEHLIVVVFSRPDFMEAAFCRVLLRDGVGMSLVYSHRIYGKEIAEKMKAWGKAHGPAAEEALMKLQSFPGADEVPKK